ncbi:hypothetical protein FACS1894127_1340 [Clostridia bacterium]|nr:hypothetical protein FACS1894127_1340 [Clostridia bacterium]
MTNLFMTILNMSVTAAFVIAALCLARIVLRKIRAPKWISYVLWAVAGFRLAVPFAFESVLSLMPIKPVPIPVNLASMEHADVISSINSGSSIVDSAIETALAYARTSVSASPYRAMTEVISYLWLIGVVVMLTYAVISYVRLLRRKDSVTTPFVYGFIKPNIHIPSGLAGEALRYVTLHEQTHIKRRDHLVKLFAFALLCVHWFNPFAWLAFVLLCADMEMSCDERVLRELGMGAKADYSQTLLSLSMNRRIFGASPLAFGEGGVKERVKNVLNFKKPARVVIVAAVVLVAVLSVGFAVNRSNENNYPVEVTASYEGKSTTIALGDSKHIPFVELGSTISLDFKDGRPTAVSVIEIIAKADGSRRYNKVGDKTLEVTNSGSNLVTFVVESNFSDGLSSDSRDYAPGKSFRWYRIICNNNGESVTEYGLWLRTDPAILFEQVPSETAATQYDPNFEFENGFEISPFPERYTLAMSNVPGILLTIDGQASGLSTMAYDCESGDFIYWEGESGEITHYGSNAKVDFGSRNLYWTPDANTKDGDLILIRLVDKGGGVMAAQGLTVRMDGAYYTLERSSPIETLPTTKNYVTAAPAAWSPDMPLGATGVPSLDYASDKYIILHDYFGIFVYELQSQRIIRSLDLAAIGRHYTQGSDYCEVAVSADGGKVYLRTMETRKMYVWDLTAEPELSLYTGGFERDWLTESFKTVSIEAAIGAAYTSEAGRYSVRAADFDGYYGYLYVGNGGNIGGLWYVVDDMVYDELFSERTSTALTFLAEPFSYGVTAKEITAILTNNTFNEKDVTCGEGYALERLYRGDWVTVPFKDNYAWYSIAHFLPVGANRTYTANTEWLKEPLEPGQYRISTNVYYGDTSPNNKITVYAEFFVTSE